MNDYSSSNWKQEIKAKMMKKERVLINRRLDCIASLTLPGLGDIKSSFSDVATMAAKLMDKWLYNYKPRTNNNIGISNNNKKMNNKIWNNWNNQKWRYLGQFWVIVIEKIEKESKSLIEFYEKLIQFLQKKSYISKNKTSIINIMFIF